jgi:hypothetical protein
MNPTFLICCEHSGVVREALRAKGVDAWSRDLLPADDASPYHIQGDCREAMRSREWGGYGMHPDCTYLTVAGIHWNNRGRGWEKTDAALAFVRELIELAGDKPWYLENPVSIISTKIRKPTQTIQPYDFGEDASKRTCLWLHRLPALRPTKRVPGRVVNGVERWANQTDSGQNKLAPSADRWKLRSKTYPGVAAAMADQWAPLLLGWKQVCFAGDCDEDGIYPKCGMDYAESECPGPTMDDHEYMQNGQGLLFARIEKTITTP